MNPLNTKWFYRGFRKQLLDAMPVQRAEKIWKQAGNEYERILSSHPGLKHHRGALVIPAVALYRSLERNNEDAAHLLNRYGESMGKRLADTIRLLTGLPGIDRLIWRNMDRLMDRMSGVKLGYQRKIVSEPPEMYGVDILSCPYHELAKALGAKDAVLCICHMDKEYSQGFRHIRYERNSSLAKGADACKYRLHFDPEKE